MSTDVYYHRDRGGHWREYDQASNEKIAEAESLGAPTVRLLINTRFGTKETFEVRFGQHAYSEQMPNPPVTGIIQVNLQSGNTRIVKKEPGAFQSPSETVSKRPIRALSSSDGSRAFGDFGNVNEPLYGWLLKKMTKGWRKGAWNRRFFVLSPKFKCLFYYTKGLHSRHVSASREGDSAAPPPRSQIPLEGAVIVRTPVEDDKPFSFTIRIPGGEYNLSARSDVLKDKWLAQIACVAHGREVGTPAANLGPSPMPAYPNPQSLLPQSSSSVSSSMANLNISQDRPPAPPQRANSTMPSWKPPPEREDHSGPASSVFPIIEEDATFQPIITEERPNTAPPVPPRPPPPPPILPQDAYTEYSPSKRLSCIVGGEAAEEHSECAICFDELHARRVGVLVDNQNRRLCRHVFHLDCLQDIQKPHESLSCPMCRKPSADVVPLPNVLSNPQRWFELLDVDQTGLIESEDVLTTLKAQLKCREDELDAQWDKLWDSFDIDHSGSLSIDELVHPEKGLVAALSRVLGLSADDISTIQNPVSPSQAPSYLENAPDLTKDKYAWFEFWDEDNSGSLDEGELLRALVHSFNKRGQRSQVREMKDIVHSLLAACDVSGDGLISREEFLASSVGLADVIIANFGFFGGGSSSSPSPTPQSQDNMPPPPPPPPIPSQAMQLEIKTNGGHRYSTSDPSLAGKVSRDTTIGELRALAADLHNNISPNRIILVCRGQRLSNDSLKLPDAGVRDGDSLVLVISSGTSTRIQSVGSAVMAANTFASSQQRPPGPQSSVSEPRISHQPPQATPPTNQCRVTVPANAGPGSTLTIRVPNTAHTIQVRVPAGYFPGSTFTVTYNTPSNNLPPPRPQQPPGHTPPPTGTGRVMRVKVPPGVQPGSQLTVNVPGTGRCRVVVPQGVHPGMEFDFRLPS